MNHARIVGTGGYLPEKVLTNADLEQMIETSADWIVERTGVEERHVAVPGETTCDLAEQASRRALQAAGIDPGEIDLRDQRGSSSSRLPLPDGGWVRRPGCRP